MNLLILNSFFLIFFGCLTIFAFQPISAIISLIILFCDAAFSVFNFEFDFLGLAFIIIYVGAIAILFLFIIMMLNIKTLVKINIFYDKKSFQKSLIAFFIFVFAFLIHSCSEAIFYYEYSLYKDVFNSAFYTIDNYSNLEIFGTYFFSYYNILLVLAGIILLVALAGAVVLTTDFASTTLILNTQIDLKQLSKFPNVLALRKGVVSN